MSLSLFGEHLGVDVRVQYADVPVECFLCSQMIAAPVLRILDTVFDHWMNGHGFHSLCRSDSDTEH